MAAVSDVIAQRYRLEKLLGQNTAQTWLAHDLQTQESVVVKGLTLQQVQVWKDQELFQREIQVLQHVQHPGIPRFREAIVAEDAWYLVMGYIPGESLAQWLEAGRRCQPELLRSWAEQALRILIDLHALQPPLVHRDLKPGNLVWHDERLYLIDFGGALAQLKPQGGSTVTGTYGYMAPEQFAGRALPASDLYSLGATLIHLASGKAPAALLNDDLVLDFAEHVNLSPAWVAWLQRMVAPLPAERFASAEQALAALAEPETGAAASASDASWREWLAFKPENGQIQHETQGEALILKFPLAANGIWHIASLLMGGVIVLLLLVGTLTLPILIAPGFVGLLLLVTFVGRLMKRIRQLHLRPEGFTVKHLLSTRRFQLAQLEKIQWGSSSFVSQGNHHDGFLELYVRYRRVNFHCLLLGYRCQLGELIWLQQLLLAWFKAHLSAEEYERLAAGSLTWKEMAARYRY